MKKRTALLMVLIFTLSLVTGCANIQDDGTRTRTEGTGAGAAIGALGGAFLGQILGGDTQSTLLGAAIGAAVGGVGGYAYGDHVAAQKEKYANQEDWLDASIAEARKKNRELVAYNRDLEQQVVRLQKEIKTLQASHGKQAARQKSLIAKKEKVEALLKEANTQLAAAREELKAQNYVKSDVEKEKGGDFTQSLDNEIAALKANINDLERRTEELASMSASMSV